MVDSPPRVLGLWPVGLVILAGCQAALTVELLGSGWIAADVETGRADSPVVLELAPAGDCPPVPETLRMTLNGVPPSFRPTRVAVFRPDGGEPKAARRCVPAGILFPRQALNEAAQGLNLFELSDSTGAIVFEVANLGRPHQFAMVNEDPPVPGRPFFLLHRGGLAPAKLKADVLGERDGRPVRLGEARVTLRGTAVELLLPSDLPGRPRSLHLEWMEPITVTTCRGVRRCLVKDRLTQLIDLGAGALNTP